MMWHVVFAEPGALPKSRAARSRDSAIHLACELLHQSYDVRRVIEPSGAFIERQELDQHYDGGVFLVCSDGCGRNFLFLGLRWTSLPALSRHLR